MVHKVKPMLTVVKLWGDEPMSPEYIKLLKEAEKRGVKTDAGHVELETRSMPRAVKLAKDIAEDYDASPFPFFEGMSGAVVRGNKVVKIFTSGERMSPKKSYIRELKDKIKDETKARKGMV